MGTVNSLYNDARNRMLTANLNWPALQLVMLAYTGDPVGSFNPAHLTQLDLGTPLAVSQRLFNPKVVSGGYAKSGAADFLALPIGTVTFFVLAEDVASPAPRRLLAYLADLNNLPFTSNGGDYLVKPDWMFSQGWFRA